MVRCVHAGRMAKARSGAMHVVRVVSRQGGREYVSHLLRTSYREDGKVKKRTLALGLVCQRVLEPASKLASAALLGQSTLGDSLGIADATEDELYRAMDWLLRRQDRVERGLAARHLGAGSLVLYDLTSTYLEGRHCPLAAHGHSRDGRADRAQIVFGLLTDERGCPVAVEAFSGNTADPATLETQIAKLRDRFGLR